MSDCVSEFLNKKTSKNLTILYHDFYLFANTYCFSYGVIAHRQLGCTGK